MQFAPIGSLHNRERKMLRSVGDGHRTGRRHGIESPLLSTELLGEEVNHEQMYRREGFDLLDDSV